MDVREYLTYLLDVLWLRVPSRLTFIQLARAPRVASASYSRLSMSSASPVETTQINDGGTGINYESIMQINDGRTIQINEKGQCYTINANQC